MSGVRGILKNLSALFTSHLLSVFTQLALTPVFIHRYGTAVYGEWLALSAAVTFLSTLDFGIQTFVNQDLTVRYHQGDIEGFHILQSTALRMLIGMLSVAGVLALVIFLLPLQRWLRMGGGAGTPAIAPHEIALTLYLLAIQVMASILFGYFTGQFMVLAKAHVGGYWLNLQRFSLIVVSLAAVFCHVRFSTLAALQLTVFLLNMLGVLIYMYYTAPEIFPTLRLWDGKAVSGILKPSGHFALIFSTSFLVYQCPVLILQHFVGPVVVVIFTVMRTIFSMTRQMLSILSQAIGPEITLRFARKEWLSLARLYYDSERLIFSTILVSNSGVLLLSPVLLALWLHQPTLFYPTAYVLAAAISTVISTKEHKYIFQFSTNTHEVLARVMFGTYVVMVAVMPFLAHRYGLVGILGDWLVVEIVQMIWLVRLNVALFEHVEKLTGTYIVRLALAAGTVLTAALFVLPHTSHLSYPVQTGCSLLLTAIMTAAAYVLFDLKSLKSRIVVRLQRKFAAFGW